MHVYTPTGAPSIMVFCACIDAYRNANTHVEYLESPNETGIRGVRSDKQSPSGSTTPCHPSEACYDRQVELFGRSCFLRRLTANRIASSEGAVDSRGRREREARPVLLLPCQV